MHLSARTIAAASVAVALAAACGGGLLGDSAPTPEVETPEAGSPVPTRPPTPLFDAGRDVEPPDDGWGRVPDRPTSAIVTVDLGVVASGGDILFDVPPNALGFNVGFVVGSVSKETAVLDLVSPGPGTDAGQEGGVDASAEAGADGGVASDRVLANSILFNGDHASTKTFRGGSAAAGVPGSNHPDVMPSVKPGTWTARFGGGTGTAKVHVQWTPDGQFHGGYVDMHVYMARGLVVDGDLVRDQGFKTIPGVRARADALGKVMRKLYGLDRGNVTFHLLDAKWRTVDDAHLGELFMETKVAGDGQALHIFLVEPRSGQQWWGIAGGIPGVAVTAGTTESALAMALLDDADTEGAVLAHEAGHFFGLSHTTEFSNRGFDPLEDTPKCPGITPSGPTSSCPDRGNVMFAIAATTALSTSALQRRVVQGSPVYRAFLEGAPPAGGLVAGGDPGRIFGHPGVALSDAEIVVLAGLCGHPDHAASVEAVASRVSAEDLRRIAESPSAKGVVRNRARALEAVRRGARQGP